MTGVGEQRGTLGPALHQVADVYRRQAETRAALVRNALPPLLIIFTAGVLVVFFVGTVMMPLVKLIEALGR